MENNIIKDILSRASENKAPIDMSDRVLTAFFEQQKIARNRPVLPAWFWYVSATLIVGAFLISPFWPSSVSSEASWSKLAAPVFRYLSTGLQNLQLILFSSVAIFALVIFYQVISFMMKGPKMVYD